MFDISWSEMLVIAVVIIVVVGPKELPGMLRTFGKTTSKLRVMANDFRKQFDDALKEAELDDLKKAADDLRSLNPRNEIRKALSPMEKAAQDVRAGLDKAMKPTATPSPSPEPASADAPAQPAAPAKPGPTAMPGEARASAAGSANGAKPAAKPAKAPVAAAKVTPKAPVKKTASAKPAVAKAATAKPAAAKAPAKKASTSKAKAGGASS